MAKRITRLPVTVVVTVRNEIATIDALINGLASQTMQPTAIHIVDGGSSDLTLQRIKEQAKELSSLNIKAWKVEGNRSVGRNAAIELAQTEWIAITDAGCVPHANWLEELWSVAVTSKKSEPHRLHVVAGYYDAIPQTAFEEAVVPYALVMPKNVDENNFLPATRSMMMQKIAWEVIGGFDLALSDNEDYVFARELAAHEATHLSFAKKAKVSWRPRSTIRQFAWMIFRFARGDVYAGIVRPKVVFIFARYLLFFAIYWKLHISFFDLGLFTLFSALFYSAWSVHKNYSHLSRGHYYLPILQVVSDWAVMLGSGSGFLKRLLK